MKLIFYNPLVSGIRERKYEINISQSSGLRNQRKESSSLSLTWEEHLELLSRIPSAGNIFLKYLLLKILIHNKITNVSIKIL